MNKMNFKDIEVPWGEIGYITFKRTYSRRIKEDDPNSKTEEFWQVVQREIDASDKQLNVGFTEKEVVLNIGFKSDGLIARTEFRDMPDLKAGDVVEVLLETKEDALGQLILSRKKAVSERAWDNIIKANENDEVINGYVKSRTKGGLVVDGTGSPGVYLDVAVNAGLIVAMGQHLDVQAKQVIDAQGLVVCPGFIDIKTHSDFTLPINPKAESKLRQGVTTEIIGHCGFSVAPCLPDRVKLLADYLNPSAPWLPFRAMDFGEYLQTFPATSVNVGMLVGHNTLRLMSMGMAQRAPNAQEMNHMQEMLLRSNAHKGASFLEIYQNCNIFNDAAFEIFTEKGSKPVETLFLEQGKPLLFGINKEKGIRLDGFKPVIVDLIDGVSANDCWIHDEKDLWKAQTLVRFFDDFAAEQELPRVFGVLYANERPTYETIVNQQVSNKKLNPQVLLSGKDTWSIKAN
jgi:hypothetical protein